MSEDEKEPKLIIDDDWKEQVQQEKEQLSADSSSPEAPAETETAEPESGELPPPPEASFEMLTTMLASQALVATGKVPNPATGKPEKQLGYARHYIDMLAMLEEKTKGNLTDEEASALSQTLHQLRMLIISVSA